MDTVVLDHRGEFVAFFRCLDMLCYAIMIQQYYQDPVILLLLFKIFVQLSYLTPKPFLQFSTFPLFYPLLVSFVISAISRLVFGLPSPSESLNGYLYGGSIINFIGEKAVSSCSVIILSDFFLFVIQIFMALVLISSNQKALRIALNQNSDRTRRPGLRQALSEQTENDHDRQQFPDNEQRQTLLRTQSDVERIRLFTRLSQSIHSLQNGTSVYPFTNLTALERPNAELHSSIPVIEIKLSDWKRLFWKMDPLSEHSSLNTTLENHSTHSESRTY
ncbi:fungal protein [Schizosaccharomyces cryophilus OY26]|uniref:Fungal protein n=1 Tax=Schizosaccharomyces cryophilus (strain OY26 / ATCC MYA-4695 / CBS 11777 / NBRC 106824 / NRRL Y48691) TaxID=653667 RepID=S9XHK5_SCHCR|nr:uncharacterized protein SPOG_03702 [Schizosaccharomyces cryophilus OY26]EPY53161.1 fungal protein [Schizosaccharomyces cryophilus OY26]